MLLYDIKVIVPCREDGDFSIWATSYRQACRKIWARFYRPACGPASLKNPQYANAIFQAYRIR